MSELLPEFVDTKIAIFEQCDNKDWGIYPGQLSRRALQSRILRCDPTASPTVCEDYIDLEH